MSTFIDTTDSFPRTPRNGWQLFQLLATGQWMPGGSWQKRAWRHKFLLRSMATPLATYQLLDSLAQLPHLKTLLQAQPGLPCRLHRPYLSAKTTRAEALAAVQFHYKQLNRLLPTSFLQSHWSSQGATLAYLEGKNGERYRLSLNAVKMLEKEGESTLIFSDNSGAVLAEITFTICAQSGVTTLFIGGLQGAKNWLPHENIQHATKACHGLFPKRLLLEALCQIAPLLQASKIIAVGNDTHIYRNWRYARKKKDKFHADYDAFWISMGGGIDNNGNFTLPLEISRKAMEEIASKKRAEYRRRYQLLDSLSAQIAERFKTA